MILDGALGGHAGENYIDTLARRWNKATQIYLDNADRMALIRYEDFCADKQGRIRALAETLGLDPRHDISEDVDVQYQPRGNRDVDWEEFFGQRNLRLIERVCAEHMQAVGYRPGCAVPAALTP